METCTQAETEVWSLSSDDELDFETLGLGSVPHTETHTHIEPVDIHTQPMGWADRSEIETLDLGSVPHTETHIHIEPVDAHDQPMGWADGSEIETFDLSSVPHTETHTHIEPVDAHDQPMGWADGSEIETLDLGSVPHTETHTHIEPVDAHTQPMGWADGSEIETLELGSVPHMETHTHIEPVDAHDQPMGWADGPEIETLDLGSVPHTETHTHIEPVDIRTQPMGWADGPEIETLDLGSVPHTETHTHIEPVDIRSQTSGDGSDEAKRVGQTPGKEARLTQTGDAAGVGQTPVTMVTEGIFPSGDAEIVAGGQAEDSCKSQKNLQALLQAARDICGASADSSPETLAQILRARWQEKELECSGVREDLERATEEKSTAHAQIKTLIAAAGSIAEVPEDSSPEAAAETLRATRSKINQWHREARAVWKERFRVMKKELSSQIKTLAEPIKLITGRSVDHHKAQDLAKSLRQALGKLQVQKDAGEQTLQDARDKVKQLEQDLKAQDQSIKCLASNVGISLVPGMKHADIVVQLERGFDDLQNNITDLETQRQASCDAISGKVLELKDLRSKMEALTSSVEALRHLTSSSAEEEKEKKEKKKRVRRFRLTWKKKSTPQDATDRLRQLQEDLVKKNADVSILEAKLATVSGRVTELEDAVRTEKDQVQRHKMARSDLDHRIDVLEYGQTTKEGLIRELRKLVEILLKNGFNKNHMPMFHVKDPVDHAAIAFMESVQCTMVDVKDILAFKGKGKAGDLQKMKLLGKGTYGKVFLGRYGANGQAIAIKQPQLTKASLNQEQEKLRMKGQALKESMMQQLLSGSTFFPKMIGSVILGGELCTVTSFIGNQKTGKSYPFQHSLTRFRPEPKLSNANVIQICEDVAEGVCELHRKGFIHNDLKVNNILLEEHILRWHGVVIDFGLASTIAYSPQIEFSDYARAEYRDGRGCYFLAPEVVLDGERYSVASDIFSFGALLKTISKRVKIEGMTKLAQSCIATDPLKRPRSMGDVLKKLETIRRSC